MQKSKFSTFTNCYWNINIPTEKNQNLYLLFYCKIQIHRYKQVHLETFWTCVKPGLYPHNPGIWLFLFGLEIKYKANYKSNI